MRTALASLALVLALSGKLAAQGTVSVSNSPATVPSPTATDYSNGNSQFSPTVGAMAVTGNCGNAGACSLKVQANSSVMAVDFKIISRSDPGGDCLVTTPADGTIVSITTTPTLVGGIKKNKNCTFNIQYRVTGLSYTAFTAGTTSTTYTQPLTFSITSP